MKLAKRHLAYIIHPGALSAFTQIAHASSLMIDSLESLRSATRSEFQLKNEH